MRLKFVKIHTSLRKVKKNLLPKKLFERVALNQIFSKISLRLPKKFLRLTIFFLLVFFFSGYHPTFNFPPLKLSSTLAQEKQEQKDALIISSFPQTIILPHPGYLSTKYSAFHPGIDIAAGLGLPIHPINPGFIEEVGRDFFGLGNYVSVVHQNGFKSKYAHLGKIYVKVEQEVSEQSILGEVGLTGHTSGPHTHLEITHNGVYIDPQTILPEIPITPLPKIKK